MDQVIAEYELQFVAFVDLLGFSEISTASDDNARREILSFLVALASLRGEFDVQSTEDQGSWSTTVKPAVSTFSDHILVSYPIERIRASMKIDNEQVAFFIMHNFSKLLGRIAGVALSRELLIRGGATIGMLYHSKGVAFGEALVEAHQIESRTSVYPRVVVSSRISGQEDWMKLHACHLLRDQDGLFHVNYLSRLIFPPHMMGMDFKEHVRMEFKRNMLKIRSNILRFKNEGKLIEYSKWTWFAHEFQSALERIPAETRQAFGLPLDKVVVVE